MPKNPAPALLALLIVLVAALLYWPGLSGSWLFDDYHNIVTHPPVHATEISVQSLATAAGAYDRGLSRPLPTMWFAIDYYLGGGMPWIFKFNSLMVHLVNVLLVFWLMLSILRLPAAGVDDPGRRTWIAAGLALVWAIHPLQVSTVLYVVQRMETLSLCFVLLALHAYVAGRVRQIEGRGGWPQLAACVPLWVLALAAKESALLLPVYTLALELTVLRFATHASNGGRAWRMVYAAGVAAALIVFVAFVVPRYANAEAYAIRNFDVVQRLLTQCRVLPMYLGQIVLPLPGSMPFYYDDMAVSKSLFDPLSTLFGALLTGGLLASAFALRRRLPLYALGILWFFGAHALTSNVVALEMVFEHRNYFALLGVVIALYDLLRRVPLREGSPMPRATGAVLLLALAGLTLLRSATWGSELMLALDLVAKNPNSSRASNDLAVLYFDLAQNDPKSPLIGRAIQEFERLADRPNASPIAEQGLISIATAVGGRADDRLWQRFVDKIAQRHIGPEEVMSLTALLKVAEDGHDIDHARLAEACQLLLSRSKQSARLYTRCGMHALMRLKDDALARGLLLEAVELSPPESTLPEDIAGALDAEGRDDIAGAVRAAHAAVRRRASIAAG